MNVDKALNLDVLSMEATYLLWIIIINYEHNKVIIYDYL